MAKKQAKTNVTPEQVTFKYKFAKEYNPVYVNGAHGGISSRGEIVINFFNERPAIPYEEVLEFVGNKTVTNKVVKPDDFDRSNIRFIENGVTMNLETAKSILVWLDDKIKTLEGAINARNNK